LGKVRNTIEDINMTNGSWQQILDTYNGSGFFELGSSIVFNGKLFAEGSDLSLPLLQPELFSWDGIANTWTTEAPYIVSGTLSLGGATFLISGGILYGLGIGNTNAGDTLAGGILQFDPVNGIWISICIPLYANPANITYPTNMVVWNGNIYATARGVNFQSNGLLEYDGANAWTVIIDRSGGVLSQFVNLIVFKGNLYIMDHGGILYEWDGTTLTQVTTTAEGYCWPGALCIFNNKLYAAINGDLFEYDIGYADWVLQATYTHAPNGFTVTSLVVWNNSLWCSGIWYDGSHFGRNPLLKWNTGDIAWTEAIPRGIPGSSQSLVVFNNNLYSTSGSGLLFQFVSIAAPATVETNPATDIS
jgi:hypothetical protein